MDLSTLRGQIDNIDEFIIDSSIRSIVIKDK